MGDFAAEQLVHAVIWKVLPKCSGKKLSDVGM